jgi:uncharacterized membrane protein
VIGDLGQLHPQVVHFVIALLFVGVGLRVVSLTPWLKFSGPAAATLLILGTLAAAVAVRSGDDAHGPVERIPGLRPLVVEHEELGKKARNIFLGVVAIELLVLGLAARPKTVPLAKVARAGSAAVGLFGLLTLYHAAEHGGEIVYRFAGGPGIRSGEPQDVTRLLVAGLYAQSQADRRAGRLEDAARLVSEMAARMPEDTTVRFLRVESILNDLKDAPAARAALDGISLASSDARLGARRAGLLADIHLAQGQPDSARAVLTAFVAQFPTNTRMKAKLDSIAAR